MKRLAIFAHFDAQHEIKPYIRFHLEQLHPHCARIDFVSTSTLPEVELDKVRPFCTEVLLKDNVGLDFGMWKHALDRAGFQDGGLDHFDEILLVNSSVFGPVFPLGPIFDRMERSPCDFWGMTDNVEFAWHLQSYFLAFKANTFKSAAFRLFWKNMLPYRDKGQVIRSYEIGLTRFLVEAGLVGEAFAPAKTLPFSIWRQFRSRKNNPTCFYPIELLRAGMPFVKVELLRDNPADVSPITLERVYQTMKAATYDLALVEFDRRPKLRFDLWPTLGRLALRAATKRFG